MTISKDGHYVIKTSILAWIYALIASGEKSYGPWFTVTPVVREFCTSFQNELSQFPTVLSTALIVLASNILNIQIKSASSRIFIIHFFEIQKTC